VPFSGLFTEVPGRNCLENRDETRIEAAKAAKSGEEDSIGLLLAQKTHGQEAFSYFPNSFGR
jgi:hypothetical protein